MTRHPFDREQREGWKSYPVRLLGAGVASCHGSPRVLVQSKEGGFVAADCPVCGDPTTVAVGEFLEVAEGVWVACPVCKRRMQAGYVPDNSGSPRNYGFECTKCTTYIWLADLLPRYQDL